MQAWTNFAEKLRNTPVERAFMPEHIAIEISPPNPLLLLLLVIICLIFVAAFSWAWIGTVDIIVTAPGKLVQTARPLLIQATVPGTIAALHITNGVHVSAGDMLIEFDTRGTMAEREHLSKLLHRSELDQQRLEALLAGTKPPSLPSASMSDDEARRIHAQVLAEYEDFNARLATIDRRIDQLAAERDVIESEIHRIDETLPFLEQRLGIRRSLEAFNSRLLVNEVAEQTADRKAERIILAKKKIAINQSIEGAKANRSEMQTSYRALLHRDLATNREQRLAITAALIKIEQHLGYEKIIAPVDGTIENLHINTTGAVVSEGQQLFTLVSFSDQTEIEAVIANDDIALVYPGQKVDIKVEAYPFTRFGFLRGRVARISRDAEFQTDGETVLYGTERSSDTTGGLSRSGRLIYRVRVAIEGNEILVDGKPVNLLSGMAVYAEIKVSERRVIDFILSPIKRYKMEVFREN